jgi:hypothetical protein
MTLPDEWLHVNKNVVFFLMLDFLAVRGFSLAVFFDVVAVVAPPEQSAPDGATAAEGAVVHRCILSFEPTEQLREPRR